MTRLLNFTFKKAKFIVIILLALVFVACEGTTTSTEPTNSSSTTEATMSKTEILEAALESINIPAEITESIELPTTITVGDNQVTVSWHSTASKVIDNTGKITPNVADKTATLVVTLEFEGEQLSDSFTVTVKGNEAFLVLYAVLNSKVNLPQAAITENLVLPTEYVIDNKTVSAMWTSSDPTSLSNSGVVTLKEYPVFVTLTLKLTYMDIIQEETYNITVAQDPDTLPVNSWHLAPLYTGTIENEAPKPGTPNCFPGAIYRKVVSSKDYWLGIEATITLPQFTPDPERYDDTKQNYYLDNSSIYMGGHSYYESDVGIAWMIGHTDGTSAQISRSGIAFRPFWRYITTQEQCTNNNCYRNANVSDYEYYYYPGDQIRMSVFSPRPGYMQMRIELISLTTNPDYVNKRSEYGLEENFNRVFLTPEFPSAGMGELKSEFKRVNAIDQVANEGKPTLNTNAKVIDAIWHEVYLYREIEDTVYKVPMTEDRTASMFCPIGTNVNGDFSNTFTVSYEGVDKALGGEVTTLDPNNGDGTLYNLTFYVEKKEEYI
jgi:hypothetical protein